MAGPSAVILGLTLGGPELPDAWTRDPKRDETEHAPQQSLAFRALDSTTGQPVPGVRIDLEAAEEQSHFYLGHFVTDARGQAEIRYPHGEFQYFDLWVNGSDYVPNIIRWKTLENGPLPAEYVFQAEPGRVIGGRLVDPAGQAIADAVIEILGPGMCQAVQRHLDPADGAGNTDNIQRGGIRRNRSVDC